MAREKILVVEDDEDIMELIAYNLEKERYAVLKSDTGEKALARVGKNRPDLVLLDLMLPGMDGLEICKRLKSDAATRDIPVLMVTAKGEESDVVAGLELGADDYLTKPFRPREMIARVRAILRRAAAPAIDPNATEEIAIHGISIHPGRREVKAGKKIVDLTYTEFQVLYALAQRPGWVFTRYQLVDAVRGENYPVTDRSVDVQIVGLRKKLGKSGHFIETVRGMGYRMKDRSASS